MTKVFAFEDCPLRTRSHAVADRSAVVRGFAALWPPARRAERVELSDDAIEAWTLVGHVRLPWHEVTEVARRRTLLGRRTLRIRGASGRIAVAPHIPRYDELERQVRVRCAPQPSAQHTLAASR